MKKINLFRVSKSPLCTMGVMINASSGLPICLTLEEPWLNNQKNISSIPEGSYLAKMINSPKFGKVYEVTWVEGRLKILIHSGNTTDNTEGCILVGNEFGELNKLPAVLNSRLALSKLHNLMGGKDFILEIREVNK